MLAWAIPLGLVIFSVLFAFFCAELVLRFQRHAWPFEPPARSMSYLSAKDKLLRWRFAPGGNCNQLGLRNREIGPKAQDSIRIMILGDSLLWSGETSSGRLFTEEIERSLNQTGRFRKRVEVINAGVPGYTTFQELEFLRAYGLDFKPDLVILGVVLNDGYDPYLHRPTAEYILEFDPAAGRYRFNPYRGWGRFFSKSYLAHELVYSLELGRDRGRKRSRYSFEDRIDYYLAWKDYGWDRFALRLGEMLAELKKRHIPLAVVIFPVSEQMDDDLLKRDRDYLLKPQVRIARICAEQRVPCLDLIPFLKQRGGAVLFKEYTHLNPAGYDVVSMVLTQFLEGPYLAGFVPQEMKAVDKKGLGL